MRNSMTIYRSFVESAQDLKPAQFKRLMMATFNYGLNDIEPTDLVGVEKALFLSWKANIDASNARRDNGRKGGRPRKKVAEEAELATASRLNSDAKTANVDDETDSENKVVSL